MYTVLFEYVYFDVKQNDEFNLENKISHKYRGVFLIKLRDQKCYYFLQCAEENT